MPAHWEYHFIEGPLECEPAPGIAAFYPNQIYKGWYTIPTLEAIETGHETLEETNEDEGPFDAAWGFSQVRLLGIKYILSLA